MKRSCPICPRCGSKKFKRIDDEDGIIIECLSCSMLLSLEV